MKDIDNTKTSKVYLKVKVALLSEVPFFASLLFDMMTVKVGKFGLLSDGNHKPTMGTDGKTIWIDEDFLNGLEKDLPVACSAVCHEISHAMWQHMSRAKRYESMGFDGAPFNAEVWNIAGDYVINAMLVSAGMKIASNWLYAPHRFDGTESVDEVYRELIEAEERKPKGGSQGEEGNEPDSSAGGGAPSDKGGQWDSHLNSQASVQPDNAQCRRAIESAMATAKAAGKMPGSLERAVTELLNPQVSWKKLFKLEVSRSIGRESTTWTRPNRRRLVSQGIYMPAYTGRGCRDIVVVVDTSGSIGGPELVTFLSEVEGILSTVNPAYVHLLGCDADISTVKRLPRGSSLKSNIPVLGGGGGTSFIPPFVWVEENRIRPAALVYLTDLLGPFPDAPKYPVIWCSTTKDKQAPFGRTIHINVKEQ